MSVPVVTPLCDELVERNEEYAHTHEPRPTISEIEANKASLPRTCIVTCVDPRFWPEQYLNMKWGEAFVFRTIAGHPQSVIEQIIGLDRVFQSLDDLMLIYHTDCGSCRFDVPRVKSDLVKDFPSAAAMIDTMDFGATQGSIEQGLRDDIGWLKQHPLMRESLKQAIKGFILDIKTGKVTRLV